MIITPEEKSNREVGKNGDYVCPTCRAKNAFSESGMGWVSCPMLDGKYICVGCCYDFQSIANSSQFWKHPDFIEFSKLANQTKNPPEELRLICINHQIKVCEDILKQGSDSELKEFLNYLLKLQKRIFKS